MTQLARLVRARCQQLRDSGDVRQGACSLEFPPLTESQIASAESRLGFGLPAALRALYSEVANGGFGPAYGLLGLSGGARQEDGWDVLEMYEEYRMLDPNDSHWSWPERLILVANLGCAMSLCVDAGTIDGAVIWFEPNPHESGEPWNDAFIPLGRNFEEVMRGWANGERIEQTLAAAAGSTYSCLCCGFRTLPEKPPGTFAICPVCFWEDDDAQFRDLSLAGGANVVSLAEARQNFRTFGASHRAHTDSVRPPRAAERPDSANDG